MAKQHPANNDDDLLEIAIGHLKNMSIPEMPQQHEKQLLQKQSPPKRWRLIAAGLIAIAASGLIAVFAFQQERIPEDNQPKPGIIAKAAPEIIEIGSQNPNESLDSYITQLNQLEQEIVHLKEKAKLLDARRKAEQLVLLYDSTKLANNTSIITPPE